MASPEAVTETAARAEPTDLEAEETVVEEVLVEEISIDGMCGVY